MTEARCRTLKHTPLEALPKHLRSVTSPYIGRDPVEPLVPAHRA